MSAKPQPLAASEREDFEERAAIMEFLGGLPRATAERMARERIERKRGQGK